MGRPTRAGAARPVGQRWRLKLGGALVLAALAAGIARHQWQPPPSVLLVTIDTLRADHVAAYGARNVRTANLDALAGRGLLFEDAVSSVPLTLPSHATILSGREPLHHGVHLNGTVFPIGLETIATLLSARGYATGGFVGAYILDRRFGLARGFDRYDDRIERQDGAAGEGPGAREHERSGGEVAEAAASWISSQTGPYLAWVHFYDPHAPYEPPRPFNEEYAGRPYDGEIAYVDSCLGRVLAAAEVHKDRPLVIAVLADHGEGLEDHGERTHGFFLYQSTLRVPLILVGPGIPAGTRSQDPARTVDLLPTLLALLKVPPPQTLDGRDLLRASETRDSYAESHYPETLGWAPLRALRRGRLKYVGAPRPELYDLASDPGESHDLIATRPQDALRLREALAASERSASPVSTAPIDPGIAERLRALGYVSGSGTPPAASGIKDPKDTLVLYRLFEEANLAEGAGDRDGALARLRDLVAREPDNIAFRRSLAAALERGGRIREALAVLEELVARVPADAIAWHERSKALEAASQLEESLRSAARAVGLNPSLPDPQNHLGILLAKRGQVEKALVAFERACSLDPNNGAIWSNTANALWVLRRTEEARDAFRRAADLAPRDPDPLNGLGVLAVEEGDLGQGLSFFRKALEISPGNAEARLNLAVTEQRRGRPEAARALVEAVLQGHPDPAHAQRAREILKDIGSSR